jgi:large subunit ribosomal protein L4
MAGEATTTTAPQVDVVDLSGSKVGTVELPAEWFSGDVNVAVMHQVVTAQRAAARQGTAKTKTRSEVRGGGRKPWRQKGTGRARHGSIRSPMWAGGGVAHGRTGEENFTKRVNKRMKRAALRSALTDRANGGNVTVVRGLAFTEPRTKDAAAALEALGHAGRKTLVVLSDLHQPTWRSFRNLARVHLLTVDQLNTYDVLNNDVVILDEDALGLIGTGRRSGTATAAAVPSAAAAAQEAAGEPTGAIAGTTGTPHDPADDDAADDDAAVPEAAEAPHEETGTVGGTTDPDVADDEEGPA